LRRTRILPRRVLPITGSGIRDPAFGLRAEAALRNDPCRAKAPHPARRSKVLEGATGTRPFFFPSLCARGRRSATPNGGQVKGEGGPTPGYESVCSLTASQSQVGRRSEKAGCREWLFLATAPAAAGSSAHENGGLRMKVSDLRRVRGVGL